MNFEWDELKNKINFFKHRIDFNDILEIFDFKMQIFLDRRKDYGEDRWIGIGLVHSVLIVVAFTERENDSIRIISARKATKNEEEKYFKKT